MNVPPYGKHAYVIPVFKKGQSSRVENYRPISLTCVLCKFFESVIKLDLSEYLAQNNILNDAQHGFLSRHSTCTNLLESINDWSLNIKNGHHSRIIFIDFAKAFDTVCHSKLLYKMSRLGIDGKLLRMLSSYLNCRTQQVLLDGALSDTKRVISGVPQGSVLGPLFFLIYINDFVEVLPKTIISKLFADDAKLYTEMEGDLDADYLQTGLDNLCKWAKKWQLKISYNKCFSMDVGLKRTQQPYPDHSIDGVLLSSVNECRDLGVIVDNKLHFTTHISEMVAKSKQRMALLFRTFIVKDPVHLVRGFKSYVLPLIDYCSQVWSPHRAKDILLIESVQRKFTKRIPGLKNLSYAERLSRLELTTLERRRLNFDLSMCYKILHGFVSGPPEKYGLILSSRMSRGHSLKLTVEHCKVDSRKFYFSNRVCHPWNSLPDSIVSANNVKTFNNNLKSINLDKFLTIKP